MATNSAEYNANESNLKANAKLFEEFWLRPKKMVDLEVVLRMKITKKWGGWKLKDELVTSLGLMIGDTINTEVSVLEGPGLIDNADDTDLFASGAGADWLLENDIGPGSIIDAKVKFVYSRAPVGGRDGKEVWKISLVFIEGYNIVKSRMSQTEMQEVDKSSSMEEMLKKFLIN